MTTRGYEALVILKSAGNEQEIARQGAALDELIRRRGGAVETAQSLGRRKLAFRISRQAEGHYYMIRFRAPTAEIAGLERLFRLNEAVVRFIILSAEEAGFAALTARPAGGRGAAAPVRG